MLLTKEQQHASSYIWHAKASCLQLIAGAGSGKTSTLVAAARNCSQNYCEQHQICLITFTRKAAAEMSARLQMAGIRPGFVGTIHALGHRVLREQLGSLQILEDINGTRARICRQLFPDLAHIPTEALLMPEYLDASRRQRIDQAYTDHKRECDLYDLEDLIILTADKLRAAEITLPYQVVMVDEFQDTSPAQVAMLQAAAASKYYLVGDDWQSIYRFRGADVHVSMQADRFFGKTKRMFLTRNFRSQSRIVSLGNKSIRLSKDFISKKLRAERKRGQRVVCHLAADGASPERALQAFADWDQKRQQQPLTVLVRTNYLRQKLEKHLPPDWQVMTIHAAKGLEFDRVAVFGIARDILPHRWGDADEEVRLLYVALSRARDELHFVAWQQGGRDSAFLPFLAKHCKLNYL